MRRLITFFFILGFASMCLGSAIFADLKVVETIPSNRATGVDPALSEIVIVFSEPVKQDSWSFVVTNEGEFPEIMGNPCFRNGRTCVLSVSLKPAITYSIGVNSTVRKGFKSARDERITAIPYVLTFTTGESIGEPEIFLDESKLPVSWTVQNMIVVPKNELSKFSGSLGGEITDLRNYIIDAGGFRLQINIVQCSTKSEAKKIYGNLLSWSKSRESCQMKGVSVVEYVCENIEVIKKAQDLLGLSNKAVVYYKIQLLVAPIKRADYMKWNKLSNLLSDYLRSPLDENLKREIKEVCKNFIFGNAIFLRTEHCRVGISEYSFSVPLESRDQMGDLTIYTFESIEHRLGIPYIKIEAKIPVKSFEACKPSEPVDTTYLTSQTAYWPVKDKDITTIVKSRIKTEMSSKQQIESLLHWINSNIKYGERIVGSRYGVKQVLEQGYGRCWDKSDVFVTLCRAAGIPARQIAGWLRGGSGHIWAEVYLSEEGWISVDPTGSWLGTSSDYIPFVISEDGKMPILYWESPQIEVREDAALPQIGPPFKPSSFGDLFLKSKFSLSQNWQ